MHQSFNHCLERRRIYSKWGEKMFGFLAQLISKGFLFFALHIRNPGSFPPALSAKEERKQLECYKNGSVEAKNILIEHNLRLVAHIVKKILFDLG